MLTDAAFLRARQLGTQELEAEQGTAAAKDQLLTRAAWGTLSRRIMSKARTYMPSLQGASEDPATPAPCFGHMLPWLGSRSSHQDGGTGRTKIKRMPKRSVQEKAAVHAILDEVRRVSLSAAALSPARRAGEQASSQSASGDNTGPRTSQDIHRTEQ